MKLSFIATVAVAFTLLAGANAGWFDNCKNNCGGAKNIGLVACAAGGGDGHFSEVNSCILDVYNRYENCKQRCNRRLSGLRFDEAEEGPNSLNNLDLNALQSNEFNDFNDADYDEDMMERRLLSHPWLTKLATSRLNTGPTGSCVATTLGNMDRLGIPSFQGGTTADPNNSRGAMVQMVKAGKWKSLELKGSKMKTIRSAYGTINAYVINADSYEKMAYKKQIPSGSIIFQTRHGWTVNSNASGNDMGIVRDGGRYTFNYQQMNPIIYSNAKEVVILVPR